VPITLIQAVGLLCGLAGVKITTWLVPPADFGVYGIFLTFTPLGMWVVHAGLIKFVLRHWAEAGDRGQLLRGVARAAWRKALWLLPAAAAAAILTSGRRWPGVFPAVFLAAVLLSFGALAQAALQAAREHWRDLAVSATGSVTRSFVPPLLYAAAGGSMMALYGGYCLYALALAVAGALALRHYWRTAPQEVRALPSVYEGPLFVVLSATGWILLGMNRWTLAFFFGPVETGYFVLAGNLATLVPTMLGSIAVQYFQPGFFAVACETRQDRQNLARRVDQVAFGHAVLTLAGLAALRGIAPWLIGPLIRENYRPALDLLLAAGCSTLAVTTGQFYHSLLLAGRRERACGPVELTAAAVLIAGGLTSAICGESWFLRWLVVSPLVPWVINRPLARRHLFRPA
jgi:O-antigen/teichoic acid export membrane protein